MKIKRSFTLYTFQKIIQGRTKNRALQGMQFCTFKDSLFVRCAHKDFGEAIFRKKWYVLL